MAHWLNKRFVFLSLLLLTTGFTIGQNEEKTQEYKEYKDKGEFNKFHKRAKVVGAWQINQLKNGALVVRLKTHKTLIDALNAQGNTKLAKEKLAETFIVNKNTMMAYINKYTFSKVYFIFSSGSDSLLKGVRSGIFLDTNLQVDPTIKMNEKYYLIAERDYAYNSSIGFVKEDSARWVKETGNPVREMGVVLKNKYGHQLKNPFPYYVKDKNYAGYAIPGLAEPKTLGGSGYQVYSWFAIDKNNSTMDVKRPEGAERIDVKIKKELTYKSISTYLEQFNDNLFGYYKSSPSPEVLKLDELTIPYLY